MAKANKQRQSLILQSRLSPLLTSEQYRVSLLAASALVWVCPLEQLDYEYYLPMFFDGIRCLEEPCTTLARQVCHQFRCAGYGLVVWNYTLVCVTM